MYFLIQVLYYNWPVGARASTRPETTRTALSCH